MITVDSPIDLNDHTFSSPLLEVPGTAAILWFKGAVTRGLMNYDDIIVISCDPLDASALIGMIRDSFQQVTITSSEAEPSRLYELGWHDSEDIHSVKLPSIYTGSTHEVSFILGREDVTIESRALSIMALMFPYARNYIVSKGVVRTVRSFLDSKNLHLPPSTGLHAEARRQEFYSKLGVFLFGFSWSNKSKIKEQLRNRINSMLASIGLKAVDGTILYGVCDNMNWDNFNSTNDVDDCLGRIVAVDAHGNHNPLIRVTGLGGLTELRDDFRMTNLAAAALEQMRVVYSHYKSTSIRFATRICRLVDNGQITLIDAFNTELTSFRRIRADVEPAPFCSVRGKIPEAYHVKQFPAIVYLGLKDYESNLKTDAEKDEWKKYKTSAVKQHISDKDLADTCELMVSSFPKNSELLVADLIELRSLEEADLILHNKSPAEINQLFELLRARGSQCVWYQDQLLQKNEAQRRQTRLEAMSVIEKQFQRTLDARQEEIINEDDADRKRGLRAALKEWRDKFESLRQRESSLEAMVSRSTSVLTAPARLEELQALNQLYDVAKGNENEEDDDDM